MTRLKISGNQLARNALLNLVGLALPLLVGVGTIPFIIRGLGTERFGLLSLAWVLLGYFTVFDLGLGRATTKFASEALGKGQDHQIPHLVWTAVLVQAALGLAGAIVLVSIAPLLAERLLKIPSSLAGEARATFSVLAFGVPVMLVSSSFSGVLEAKQRFGLVNAVRIPSSVLTYLLPLAGVILGLRLPSIVALMLLSRFAALSALAALSFRVFPDLKRFSVRFSIFPHLLRYGGWVTVTSVTGPVLVYLDRFLVGSLLSVAAVAYYTAPYEIVTRLWIIPWSLAATLFPAFSALEGVGDRQRLETLFARSVKYTLLSLGPVVLMLTLFSQAVLHAWLGDEFAARSTAAMQILALGVLINSLAHVPFALLQGLGRPDITAKFHLLELPVYVWTAWVLVSGWGIAGAAAAWTLRAALDALLLFVAAVSVCRFSSRLWAANGLTLTGIALLLLAIMAYGLKSLAGALPVSVQLVLFAVLLGSFGWVAWRVLLDSPDREAALRAVRLWRVSEDRV